ncbi:PadR family transcriptional regulator [Salinibacterium sp. ZJ450]|uniref:PadR family transcriptional regulator n=1 Tax=Salinibacterium sp. ZJ450 TaxID=2708338 RepID=UPI00142074CC|nr:helix-turn-helix transcriptional regulator [Salinibacterium sp. ZJ450]
MDELARVTAATVDVLRVLSAGDDACWGLRVIKGSGRPPGSVYPILERLERAGWVSSAWEAENDRPGPRRRFYKLSDGGAVAARAVIARFDAKSNASFRPTGAQA